MRYREQFLMEVECRKKANFESEFVVEILESFDSDTFADVRNEIVSRPSRTASSCIAATRICGT